MSIKFHKADEPKKSTAARLGLTDVAPTDVQLGVPKQKVGRPSTGFDRNAYQRDYMADRRKAKPLGMTVKEYRDGRK